MHVQNAHKMPANLFHNGSRQRYVNEDVNLSSVAWGQVESVCLAIKILCIMVLACNYLLNLEHRNLNIGDTIIVL